LFGLNIRGLEIQHDFGIFEFFRVLDQLLLPSYLSAILAVRILIDIDSSSELLKGLHAQDLLDHFQIKTKDFEINLCAPIYLYTFPILEKLNGSSALAWSIVQGEPLLKALEVVFIDETFRRLQSFEYNIPSVGYARPIPPDV
ncbi:hypothetical protein Tco_0472268, partial [Tanacetum coccineum]